MAASLGYAFYLASSWLWCIGAFLPVLLLRDYGWASLLGFALVNIGGAAAFGWVLRPDRQQAFMARHAFWLEIFSRVTMAYQLFFVVWLSVLISVWLLPLMLLLATIFYLTGRWSQLLAVGLFLVSLLLFALYQPQLAVTEQLTLAPGWWHTLLPLALGFLLSPYLDITFHRALALSPHPRWSFTLGFGLFFLCLLAFVFFYSQDLRQLMAGGAVQLAVIWPVVAFILLQTAFTLAVHFQEIQRFRPRTRSGWLLSLVGVLLVFFPLLQAGTSGSLAFLSPGELIYKGFLYAYGLVFPLYLLLGQNRRLFWLTLLLASPAYALGFLLGQDYLYFLSLSLLPIVVAGLLRWLQKPARLFA
ncbi:hypothetical protein [Marinospirillum perlucidum]|uniref:hypothetical protein n=1 Tax=Marinospirillum perlucidum TaxID=1982602 RepID=UPI000DF1B60D|nr:hypothetical protein [Marinospirillum perlucidum]